MIFGCSKNDPAEIALPGRYVLSPTGRLRLNLKLNHNRG